MKRRTLVKTAVIVEEQTLRPRKSEIRRRVRMEKAIAAGINIAFIALSALLLIKVGLVVYAALMARAGGIGGEILVLPAMAVMFAFGRDVGRQEQAKRLEVQDEEAEC